MGDELERAARRQRSRRARRADRAAKAAAERATSAESRRRATERRMLIDALEKDELPGGIYVIGGAGVLILVALMWLEFGVGSIRLRHDELVVFALVFADLVAATALVISIGLVYGLLRLRSLRRVGYGFDADSYIAELSRKRRHGRLAIEIRFAREWPADRRDATVDATREWMGEDHDVEWRDATLLAITSPRIDARFCDPDDDVSTRTTHHFSNQLLHRGFDRARARVLPALHAIVPIASTRATILGDTLPWDADAD